MMSKIIAVYPLSDGYLHVVFDDGRKGEIDTKPFMISDYFKELETPNYFSQVTLFFDGVGWPNGQDLSPDTIAACMTDLMMV